MEKLVHIIIKNEIKSIAIPALGSGLVGLDLENVKTLPKRFLQTLEEAQILIYELL